MVRNLKLNPRVKLSVFMILGLSALGSTATIVRIPYITELNDPDFLHSTCDIVIWSFCEVGIGLVASSAVTLRPLFRSFYSNTRLLPKQKKSASTGASSTSRASPRLPELKPYVSNDTDDVDVERGNAMSLGDALRIEDAT